MAESMKYVLNYAGTEFEIESGPIRELLARLAQPGTFEFDTNEGRAGIITGPGIPIYVTPAPDRTVTIY